MDKIIDSLVKTTGFTRESVSELVDALALELALGGDRVIQLLQHSRKLKGRDDKLNPKKPKRRKKRPPF